MMRTGLLGLGLITALSSPAIAQKSGVAWDGATDMIAHRDPFATPRVDPRTGETNMRVGAIVFRYASEGQKNFGPVTFYDVIPPNDQYKSSVLISWVQRNNAQVNGYYCPYLRANGISNDNDQKQWDNANCSARPDPSLYNSGVNMGLRLELHDPSGTEWFLAMWEGNPLGTARDYGVLPMDGTQHVVQIYYFTGSLTESPYAKLVVCQRYGPCQPLADPSYFDSSWDYEVPADGFSVALENRFWMMGCQTTDPKWVDTCVTTLSSEFWLYPASDVSEVDPLPTFTAMFLGPANSAPDLGPYGDAVTGFPPLVYNTGDDTTWIVNQADRAWGGTAATNPQTSTVEGRYFDSIFNPNYQFLGGTLQAAGQNF